MDLINKQVIHKSFGKGNVVGDTDSYIEVHFTSGNKKFVFPDAFKTHLTMVDQRAAESVGKMMQKREKEIKQEELEIEKGIAQQRIEKQRLMLLEKPLKSPKIHPSSQAAFWCEAGDQDRVFEEWSVFTGVTKSGVNEGKPNRPARLHQNSACVLTAKNPGMSEKDRCILGLYMVNEDFVGNQCEDGYISAHPDYRIRLSQQESEKILFWNYYLNEKYPDNMTWNTGKYRYFENIWVAQILKDIVSLKSDPQEQESAQHFFEHFCKMNKIKDKELPKLNGALINQTVLEV